MNTHPSYTPTQESVPDGYRWVYGQLEKLPEPITAPVDWEKALNIREEAKKLQRLAGMGEWFQPLSPDGTAIDPDATTYRTARQAIIALIVWVRRYRSQGGYRTGRGEFIPYSELPYRCDIVPV